MRGASRYDGRELQLTAKEFDLLALLASDPGSVVEPRDDPSPRLGHDVVRRPEDDRRARRVASQEARRPRRDRDGPGHRLPLARMSRRLLLGYLSLTALVLSACSRCRSAITYARNERSSLSSKVERDAVAVASVADDVLEQSSSAHRAAARRSSRTTRPERAAASSIVNERGVALVDTDPPASRGAELRVAARDPRPRLSGRVASGVRHSQLLGTDLLYVAVPVASNGVSRAPSGSRIRRRRSTTEFAGTG